MEKAHKDFQRDSDKYVAYAFAEVLVIAVIGMVILNAVIG